MEKKELKRITTEIYKEYGFVKKGERYYLDLDDVVICSRFSGTAWCENSISFVFRIKKIHADDERPYTELDYFDDFDSLEYDLALNRYSKGNRRYEIRSGDYSGEDYKNLLRKLLTRYYDPFKCNALEHIKNGYLHPGYIDPYDKFVLTKEAIEKLDIPRFTSPTSEEYEQMVRQWEKEAFEEKAI